MRVCPVGLRRDHRMTWGAGEKGSWIRHTPHPPSPLRCCWLFARDVFAMCVGELDLQVGSFLLSTRETALQL